jgi:hypothetical protein
MGVALAAITDDGHFLGFDQINVCVAIIENAHISVP